MFGQNPVAKRETTDGTALAVVQGSPFYTIQGEGPYAGRPAVFVRLHGCPLRCFFCDTEFSHEDDPTIAVDELYARIEQVAPSNCGLVVITGGEPTRQNLEPLIGLLLANGWTVQVETAGLFWQPCLEHVTLVVSPKSAKIDPQVAKAAYAYKYVLQAEALDPEDGLPLTNTQVEDGPPARLARPPQGWAGEIYVNPMDEYKPAPNEANIRAVATTAMKHGYIAGLQLHKIFGLD